MARKVFENVFANANRQGVVNGLPCHTHRTNCLVLATNRFVLTDRYTHATWTRPLQGSILKSIALLFGGGDARIRDKNQLQNFFLQRLLEGKQHVLLAIIFASRLNADAVA